MSETASATLQVLRSSRPALHGKKTAQSWRLDFAVLEWLATALRADWCTAETGCGYSTLLFAASDCRHTAISPVAEEHARILEWCGQQGIETNRLSLHAAPSEQVLPGMDLAPLDLVLIDGAHWFPIPFLDWYYLQRPLKRGGLCVVDDTQLATGWILRDFLQAESGRWSLEREFRRTVVFRKEVEDALEGAWWGSQPWIADRVRRRGRLWRAWRRVRGRGRISKAGGGRPTCGA